MSINFSAASGAFDHLLNNFKKTLTYTVVTKTTSNTSGKETLTDGSTTTIYGPFFRQEDVWNQEFSTLLQTADAVLLIDPDDTTVAKNGKITYDGETYRVQKITTRRFNETKMYRVARCFKV